MKVKVSEASDILLDWMVTECEGELSSYEVYEDATEKWKRMHGAKCHRYSTDWAQGGPILSREHISRTIDHSGLWIAYWTDGYTEGDEGKQWMHCDRSELVAGLRCFCASKLGDAVEVPDELMQNS